MSKRWSLCSGRRPRSRSTLLRRSKTWSTNLSNSVEAGIHTPLVAYGGTPSRNGPHRRHSICPRDGRRPYVDHEQCGACRFDGSDYDPAQLVGAIRDLGPEWIRLLLDAGDELRQRPAPETW